MAAYKKRLAPLRTHLGVVLDGLTPKMNEWLVESMLIMMGKRSYSQQISAMGNSHLKKVNLWKCKKALLGVVVVVLSCFIQRPVGLLMYIYNCIYIYDMNKSSTERDNGSPLSHQADYRPTVCDSMQ